MFMDDNGNIAYIDNDQAHGSAWRDCGAPPLLPPAACRQPAGRPHAHPPPPPAPALRPLA
jgi:hypothetical protein